MRYNRSGEVMIMKITEHPLWPEYERRIWVRPAPEGKGHFTTNIAFVLAEFLKRLEKESDQRKPL